MAPLTNLRDKLEDDTLDLSLCDLTEVPVREIAAIKKAAFLDLSNNSLVSLPKNFIILTQVVKLDLSHNMLTEIPENFGELRQLKHLDLYSNQISRLPLSLGELKNLKWLDLKNNPLTQAVASVAGPCGNASECQTCARNVVAFLANVKKSIEEEKLNRTNATQADTVRETVPLKKESKKKKKKNADKDSKSKIEKEKSANPESERSNNSHRNQLNGSTGKTSMISQKENGRSTICRSFLLFILGLIILGALAAVAVTTLPPKTVKEFVINARSSIDYIQVHFKSIYSQYFSGILTSSKKKL